MAKNFVKDGKTLTWTNGTGTAVASGDLVMVENIPCVAAVDIANGATGELYTEGVFTLPAVNNAAFAQGKPLYLVASTGKLSLTAEDQKYVGLCWTAKAETATTAACKIGGYHPTVNESA